MAFNFWVERGKGWAMSGLGDRYRQGLGVPKDEQRAFELYTMAAEQDYVSAILSLGYMYVNVRYQRRSMTQYIHSDQSLFPKFSLQQYHLYHCHFSSAQFLFLSLFLSLFLYLSFCLRKKKTKSNDGVKKWSSVTKFLTNCSWESSGDPACNNCNEQLTSVLNIETVVRATVRCGDCDELIF